MYGFKLALTLSLTLTGLTKLYLTLALTGRVHQGIRKNNYDLQGFEPQTILRRAAVLPTVPQPLLQESAESRLYRGRI